ncbi:MAG TPA: nuclear transport factor 2 family protein [Xanthomonadaceae bacterium]|jgi:hypothetical protein|nr:nuclear transport factor 2 family protein [Xanthomonadaceae bacterium]
METLDELEAARRRHPEELVAGSDDERAALDRFAHFFGDFEPDRVTRMLDAVYAPDVYFNDSLKAIRGSADLARYLEESAAGVEDCKVTIEDITRNQHGEYMVRWKMLIRFRRFARGRDTWTVGITHLRFAADGRVTYHQDYWDSARGVYEHIPLLGSGIRAIRRRI